jgi:hypothetical protein
LFKEVRQSGRADGVPSQAGTTGAVSQDRKRGSLKRSLSWKEGPLTRQKGGARSYGQEVDPDRSFLPLRKLRVADLLSFTLVPLATDVPGCEGGEEK